MLLNLYVIRVLVRISGMSLLYAKRGQCYLQLGKPNACIRDCTKALAVNPDNAAAYKFRGRAHRLLGQWLDAVKDLRRACQIDFDEQADEWLKEVTPNVSSNSRTFGMLFCSQLTWVVFRSGKENRRTPTKIRTIAKGT